MPRPGPRTTNKYSDRFKATAVRLSELPGVEVQDVAASLYTPNLEARFVSGAMFIGRVGGTGDDASAKLAAAFAKGGHATAAGID
jgi:hypothetical protein